MENIKTAEMQNVTANLEAALKNLREYSRYTPEDVDRLEHAAWDALGLLKEGEQDATD